MGGSTSKKLAANCAILDQDEQARIGNAFRIASRNHDKIKEAEIVKLWGPFVDPRFTRYITNFLFGFGSNKTTTVDFQRFAEFYVYNVRGSVDERVQMIINNLGENVDMAHDLPYSLLKEYCEAVASTFMKILKGGHDKYVIMWMNKGFRSRPEFVQSLGECIAATTSGAEDVMPTALNYQALTRWMGQDSILHILSEYITRNLYSMPGQKRNSMTERSSIDASSGHSLIPELDEPENQDTTETEASQLNLISVKSVMPKPEGLESMPDYPAFIDLAHIVWLNMHLPMEYQLKWRFLFSAHIHGESFVTMIGRIVDQGPSLIIIEDHQGYIFGGFAARQWQCSPNFAGSEESFLFTLAPKMRHFPSSGFNNHFQYLNTGQKAMTNGLAMGGQLEYPGLMINAEFGTGTSAETCITFRGYKQLSRNKEFRIRNLDVWGVGDKPLSVKDSDEREISVLDRNHDARAILRLAGRTEHSDGIREPVD